VNFVILIVSALLSLAAAANPGSPQLLSTGTSAGVTAAPVPTPSPSPAPPIRYDAVAGGGPT
jgi:hypothetical protein